MASILVKPPCRWHAPIVVSRSQRSYPAAGIFHSSSSLRTRSAASSSSSRQTCSAATSIQQLSHGNQQAARIRTPANQGQRHQQLSIQRRGVANVVAEATVLFRDASNSGRKRGETWSGTAGPRCARCVSDRVSRCERDRARVCVLMVVHRWARFGTLGKDGSMRPSLHHHQTKQGSAPEHVAAAQWNHWGEWRVWWRPSRLRLMRSRHWRRRWKR